MTWNDDKAWLEWLTSHHNSTYQQVDADHIRVVCPCGWESELFTDKRRADYAMDHHTGLSAREYRARGDQSPQVAR